MAKGGSPAFFCEDPDLTHDTDAEARHFQTSLPSEKYKYPLLIHALLLG